jgi:3-phytase
MQRLAVLMLSPLLLTACNMTKSDSPRASSAKPVFASVETEPVMSSGDAADDPAIWIHPTDPSRSLVIGTNKKQGLDIYDLTGKRVQALADGKMNNVDLRYGFPLDGANVAIVAATNRTDQSLALYAIDNDGDLRNVTDGNIPTGLADSYGLCMYRNPAGEYFVFANDADSGNYKQWKLHSRGSKVGATLVREIAVGSQAEGCATDDANGRLYIAEEDVGLWRYSAEPNGGSDRVEVDSVKRGHLTADAEGVTIFYGTGNRGYLIVSSQGSNDYNVYRRDGDNAFIGKFAIVADSKGIDGTSDTDGIDVTSTSLGSAFAHGVFIVQDGDNTAPSAAQNFKLVPWERIAKALNLPL